MRTFLRLLGAVMCLTAVALTVVLIGYSYVESVRVPPRPEVAGWALFPWAGIPLFMLCVVAALGGILYCLADHGRADRTA